MILLNSSQYLNDKFVSFIDKSVFMIFNISCLMLKNQRKHTLKISLTNQIPGYLLIDIFNVCFQRKHTLKISLTNQIPGYLLIDGTEYKITVNPVNGCDIIKTKNDVASITLSKEYQTDNLHELRTKIQESIYSEISNRYDEMSHIEKKRDKIMNKLCDSSEIDNKRLQKINHKFLLYCNILKNHATEIEKLRNATCEIEYEKQIDEYSICIPPAIAQIINGIPNQREAFVISWLIENTNKLNNIYISTSIFSKKTTKTRHGAIINKFEDNKKDNSMLILACSNISKDNIEIIKYLTEIQKLK